MEALNQIKGLLYEANSQNEQFKSKIAQLENE